MRIVHFGFNSTRVSIPSEEAAALVEETKAAPLVILRGRTDGTSDSSAESRIAQARANAVREYLVASGVDPSRIRTTHQPSGDHLADNRSPQGKNLNRRVEIEVYRVLPLSPQVSVSPQP
ncbi:type VI secretion system peptidoglycan-associated domain protein [compost metagenome]